MHKGTWGETWLRGVWWIFLKTCLVMGVGIFCPSHPLQAGENNIDLYPHLSDTASETSSKSLQVSCEQVKNNLMKMYENNSYDKMFAHRLADLFCRCKELTPQHPYTIYTQDSPQCLEQLWQCYSMTTPRVVKAIESCRQNGKTVEACKSLDFSEVIEGNALPNFSEKYEGIQRACGG